MTRTKPSTFSVLNLLKPMPLPLSFCLLPLLLSHPCASGFHQHISIFRTQATSSVPRMILNAAKYWTQTSKYRLCRAQPSSKIPLATQRTLPTHLRKNLYTSAVPIIPLCFFNLLLGTLSSLKAALSQYYMANIPKEEKCYKLIPSVRYRFLKSKPFQHCQTKYIELKDWDRRLLWPKPFLVYSIYFHATHPLGEVAGRSKTRDH